MIGNHNLLAEKGLACLPEEIAPEKRNGRIFHSLSNEGVCNNLDYRETFQNDSSYVSPSLKNKNFNTRDTSTTSLFSSTALKNPMK